MKPNILQDRVVYDGNKFSLHQIDFQFQDNEFFSHEYIKHFGSSAIIPFIDSETIILVKQWRYSVGKYVLEIPSGNRKISESPIQCARRELREETNYDAKQIRLLCETLVAPGYSSEKCCIFSGKEIFHSPLKPDLDEHIEVNSIKINNVPELIRKGKILDQTSITALLLMNTIFSG